MVGSLLRERVGYAEKFELAGKNIFPGFERGHRVFRDTYDDRLQQDL
jgi:hypothetical protein